MCIRDRFHDLAERAIIDCIQSPETQQVIQNLIQASYHPETLNMEDIIKELGPRRDLQPEGH